MRLKIALVSLVMLSTVPGLSQTNCDYFNYSLPSIPRFANDSTQHVATAGINEHDVSGTFYASCTYTNSTVTPYGCVTLCTSSTTGTTGEYGKVVSGTIHATNDDDSEGSAEANALPATCGGQTVGAAKSCLIIWPCNISVSLSASADGLGGSATFSSAPLWSHTLSGSFTCNAQTLPVPPPPCVQGPAPYEPPDVGAEYVWVQAICAWVLESCAQAGCSSPIVIDTDGSGFSLTAAKDGVEFDFFDNGHPVRIAWTAPGSTNGWLALDRNSNGTIDNGLELFGNLTPQPDSQNRNGFLALAQYDTAPFGGNGDGVIDSQDSVWSGLRVWVDANHDGISQSAELHTLDEIGIQKIDLKYKDSSFVDANGNKFHYKGHLVPIHNDQVNRTIYDVFLTTQ